jgi:hypothetical protein
MAMDYNSYMMDSAQLWQRCNHILAVVRTNSLMQANLVETQDLETIVRRYQTINDITYPTPVANNNQAVYEKKSSWFKENRADSLYVTNTDTGLNKAKVIHMAHYNGYSKKMQFENMHNQFKSNVDIFSVTEPLPAQEPINNNVNPTINDAPANKNATRLIDALYGNNNMTTENTVAEAPVVEMTSSPPISKKTGNIITFPAITWKERKLII